MENIILSLHNLVRWFILLFALITIVRSAMGMGGKRPFTVADKRSALFLLISCDIQLLLGIYLFVANGWWNKLQNMGSVMHDKYQRFFTMEHNVAMIIAIVLVHIGYSAAKKNISDKAKFKKLFWFVLIALVVILISIPWPGREIIGKPLYRIPA